MFLSPKANAVTIKPISLNKDVKEQRKIISENYSQIDDKFLQWKKPRNPYDYIDRKVKKIYINPGFKYVSSSQHEILEPRLFNMLKKDKKGKKTGTDKYLLPP